MDLNKIAENTEMTYLEKVAAIVDEFAAGNVDGETADSIAVSAGINPEDLLSVYNAAYGEGGDIEKTASAEDGEAEMTYLQKVATVVDEFAAGELTAEDVEAIAEEHGLSADDINSVYAAAYGEGEGEGAAEVEDGDIEKTAADEAIAELVKVAESEDATYLEKCAGIADAFAAGAITDEEVNKLSSELGLSASDVESVYNIAYSKEDLGKEAGEASVLNKIKQGIIDAATAKQYKKGVEQAGKAASKSKTFEQLKNMGKNSIMSEKGKKIAGDKAGKAKAAAEKFAKESRKNKIIGGAKTTALYGGGAATLLGAGYAAGKKKDS